jgi:hypothetical protein
MSLAQMKWVSASIHHAILAWLRAERDPKLTNLLLPFPPLLWSAGLSRLLDQPKLDDPEENRARLRLFYLTGRHVFSVEIPPDTEWYEVHDLTDTELGELHVVNYQEWNDPADKNELMKVAARKKIPLREPPSAWQPPILWGHSTAGPFTIIEGNTRLTAYAGSGQSGLHIPVLVGLSKMQCVWHILDSCQFLMQDLIHK